MITGILISYHKVAIPSAPVLVGMFILGLVLLAITSDYDPDAKRVAAISTCTIIIVCWLGILTSSPVSWTWAQLHAGYKATLFLGITVFASTFTMQDLRSLLAHPITPYLGLLLVVLFAIVIPGSDYDLTKHHLKLDIDSDWQLEFLSTTLKVAALLTLALYWSYSIALHLWNLAVELAFGPPGYSTYTGTAYPSLGNLRIVLQGLACAAFTGILIYLAGSLYLFSLSTVHRLAM